MINMKVSIYEDVVSFRFDDFPNTLVISFSSINKIPCSLIIILLKSKIFET